MPTPANIVASVQQLYDALTTWSGKPAAMHLGPAWPDAAELPLVVVTHQGTETQAAFEYSCIETWRFELGIWAETAQLCVSTFDRIRFNSVSPGAGGSGFWYPASVTMPAGYAFMSMEPAGGFRLATVERQFSPTGTMLHNLTWPFEVVANRTTFAG